MLSTLILKKIVRIPLLLATAGILFTDTNAVESERRNSVECIGAQAFCSEQSYTFPNSTNTTAPNGPNYGCLSSAPNPIWYYMEVAQPGVIKLKIEQTTQPNGQGAPLDVDFAMWGPFDSYENGCRAIMQGTRPIQSSYSPSTVEYVGIGTSGGNNSSCGGRDNGQSTPPAAQAGEIYIILLTNYSADNGYISFNQVEGDGGANCEIVNPCSFSEITANATCNGNFINYTGSIAFTDAPDEGTLTVRSESGGSQVFYAPFTSPIQYSFTGPNTDTQNTNISVSFSADECTKVKEVLITNYITPTFTISSEICLGSEIFDLPTSSNEGIIGTWDKTVNTNQTETYTFTPNPNQCALTTTAEITVKEKPTVALTTTSNRICTGSRFDAQLTSAQNNVEFLWIVEATNVTGAQGGRGNTISDVLTTNNPNGGQVKYLITPFKDGCQGDVFEYVIDVLPKPSVFAPSTLEICSGTDATIYLSSNYNEITYRYRVEEINVSGAFDGQGNLISQNLITTTATVGYVNYYITPVLNGCEGDEIIVQVKVNPVKVVELTGGYICLDETGKLIGSFTITTEITSDYNIQWFKNNELILGATENFYEVLDSGFYHLVTTDKRTGCQFTSNPIEIKNGNWDHLTTLDVQNNLEFGKVSVETIGNGNYVYQLDGGGYSGQNVYTDLYIGEHYIEVKDLNGCYYKKIYFTIFSYPNFFTPNGDGINDTWNIWALKDQKDAEIFIFDRTGKLLKQITPKSEGWDGTYHNKPLPTNDYWFIVKYRDGRDNNWREFKSHFSLKR